MLTMLLTRRGNIHFCERGLTPECRSRAEVTGFKYERDGEFHLPPHLRGRLCKSCMDRLGIVVDTPAQEEGE